MNFEILQNEKCTYTYAFDMKLANIFLGLGTASSTYPCTWWEISKDNFICFNRTSMEIKLRDIKSIQENASKYQMAVSDYQGKKTKFSSIYEL